MIKRGKYAYQQLAGVGDGMMMRDIAFREFCSQLDEVIGQSHEREYTVK